MSNSMVSTVLEIEREAEGILTKARQDAASLIADAKTRRAAATKAAEEKSKKEIADLEAKAAVEREKKVRELTATGDAALAAIRNVSDAAFNSGVGHVMKALAGK